MNPNAINNVNAEAVTSLFPPSTTREIYKAGWVRRSSSIERREPPFNKKYCRLWSVFCMHDDTQPFLEFYSDPKSSITHQPVWVASLTGCMHISPSIIIQGDSFEFVVTLASGVLRLGTATREQMNEWIEILRNRLRDIKVLEPKENLYSPFPESRQTFLTATRDPNSPLPLPPLAPVVNTGSLGTGETSPELDVFLSSEPTELSTSELTYTPETSSNDTEIVLDGALAPEHVTIISVNPEAEETSGVNSSERSDQPFSTHVRIASASSSSEDAEENTPENCYETIFSIARPNDVQPSPSTSLANQGSNSRDLRPSAQISRRLVLRRCISLEAEQQTVAAVNFTGAHPTRDRRREGTAISSQMVTRSTSVVVPARFMTPHRPLGPMLSSPLLRHVPALALQPLTVNHGAAENGCSLKERQVSRLRMEMQHPAGVRIILRKKDCINTIALIEGLGAVWVGGWRQKEKPLLYNVFHIGDQIVRVGRCNVSSASDVHRLIKNDTGSQIELIVRRIPFGRVFLLRRDVEGQSLGIVTEGNSAEIREVVPGGIAAQLGVPPMAVNPLGGASGCTWTMTEINGRPLNLCSKEAEARHRLNAVGKAITILMQPTEFVKLLKKQLKNVRGYKDYLLG